MSWDVYDRLLNAYGDNDADRAVELAKETFIREAMENPGYHPDCKRNGIAQRFLIERSDVAYKFKFVTFPGEEIYPGDLIECGEYKFIIIEPPRFMDKITWAAIGRLSNLTLTWQDFSGKICSSPVCLDAGVYSTTMNGTDTIMALDKQFKLYLPYTDETASLYIDKRIAVDSRYDKYGNRVLECYRITGMSRVARTYGTEGHLLVCELRSTPFSPEHDNVDLLICDYVLPGETPVVSTDLPCRINGRNKLRIGRSQRYSASFYSQDDEERDDVTAIWDVSNVPSVLQDTFAIDNNNLVISLPSDENLVGETFTISISGRDTDSYAEKSCLYFDKVVLTYMKTAPAANRQMLC